MELDKDSQECTKRQQLKAWTSCDFKDGLHLMFPQIRCSTALKHLARLHVMEECKHVIMSINPTNDVVDIVDKAVIDTNNWFMFGSGKPGGKPYDLITVLQINDGEAVETITCCSIPFTSVFMSPTQALQVSFESGNLARIKIRFASVYAYITQALTFFRLK